MSPEVALAADYDLASDIFSFGIVICELITGIPPSTTFMCRQPRNTFALDEEEVGRHVPLDCPEGLEGMYIVEIVLPMNLCNSHFIELYI